ncbi:hypothetical protein EJ08DRAFT_319478 [Tothia fuscella]|uniref:Uncharacterized protein n=1 Tax=Tothia fuscella TaxID=1048955 RepID=A0A9P4TW19_9PEZI|nr:hypothetical protein EJ08DRAFT_319478 [Tothia fuscella]
MHIAAMKNRVDIMELYLQHKGSVNEVWEGDRGGLDFGGGTPLHMAITQESTESVQWLLERGADSYIKDQNGQTAAELGSESKNDIIKGLVDSKNLFNKPELLPLTIFKPTQSQLLDRKSFSSSECMYSVPPNSFPLM